MKDIVIKYLSRQYTFTPKTYINFSLLDKLTRSEVGLPTVFKTTIKILGVGETELLEYFNLWADEQAIIMNNRITDYKYAYYQKYGIELEPAQLNDYVFNEDFIPTTSED